MTCEQNPRDSPEFFRAPETRGQNPSTRKKWIFSLSSFINRLLLIPSSSSCGLRIMGSPSDQQINAAEELELAGREDSDTFEDVSEVLEGPAKVEDTPNKVRAAAAMWERSASPKQDASGISPSSSFRSIPASTSGRSISSEQAFRTSPSARRVPLTSPKRSLPPDPSTPVSATNGAFSEVSLTHPSPKTKQFNGQSPERKDRKSVV